MRDFSAWMAQVDDEIDNLTGDMGLDSNDISDYCYRDAYDDGRKPLAVAKSALRSDDSGWRGAY